MNPLQIVNGGRGLVVVARKPDGHMSIKPNYAVAVTRRHRRGKRVQIMKLHENGQIHKVVDGRTVGRVNRKFWRAAERAKEWTTWKVASHN